MGKNVLLGSNHLKWCTQYLAFVIEAYISWEGISYFTRTNVYRKHILVLFRKFIMTRKTICNDNKDHSFAYRIQSNNHTNYLLFWASTPWLASHCTTGELRNIIIVSDNFKIRILSVWQNRFLSIIALLGWLLFIYPCLEDN